MPPPVENKNYDHFDDVVRIPDDSASLMWRYMDFPKFVSLLEHRGIYFPRADLLGDPFEGAFGTSNEHEPAEAARWFSWMSPKWFRQWSYISCWHINPGESAGMWSLYGKTGDSIAIVTTAGRMQALLNNYEWPTVDLESYPFVTILGPVLGRVKYIDYEAERVPGGNVCYPFFHKRLSFQHENEVRAWLCEVPILPSDTNDSSKSPWRVDVKAAPAFDGKWVAADLSTFLDAVYVSPTASTWFTQLVRAVCERYQLKTEIRQSAMNAKPAFF